jgi:hypothetical protein
MKDRDLYDDVNAETEIDGIKTFIYTSRGMIWSEDGYVYDKKSRRLRKWFCRSQPLLRRGGATNYNNPNKYWLPRYFDIDRLERTAKKILDKASRLSDNLQANFKRLRNENIVPIDINEAVPDPTDIMYATIMKICVESFHHSMWTEKKSESWFGIEKKKVCVKDLDPTCTYDRKMYTDIVDNQLKLSKLWNLYHNYNNLINQNVKRLVAREAAKSIEGNQRLINYSIQNDIGYLDIWRVITLKTKMGSTFRTHVRKSNDNRSLHVEVTETDIGKDRLISIST